MTSIDMVIDLQYGSTGKGLLAGFLAHQYGHDTIMTAWAPNAGHTFIDFDGRKFVHTMLANGIVGPSVKRVLMGPGSLLNLDQLNIEISQCRDIIDAKCISIFIHAHAGVVTAENVLEEQGSDAIGSTKKGVGAAAISKIRRHIDYRAVVKGHEDHPVFDHDFVYMVPPGEWIGVMDLATRVLIEGAQGFGLSIQHGFYPYTTSRDVTPMQILADCGVPFNSGRRAKVFGTARTFPIRVSNRFDKVTGEQTGWSGPCYDDQRELDWQADFGMAPELTTVTKLPRRIFTYSHQQMFEATAICGTQVIFLNFCNYLKRIEEFKPIFDSIHRCRSNEILYGVGPGARDVLQSTRRNVYDEWMMLQAAMETRRDPNVQG